jgi:hypothetical protein
MQFIGDAHNSSVTRLSSTNRLKTYHTRLCVAQRADFN